MSRLLLAIGAATGTLAVILASPFGRGVGILLGLVVGIAGATAAGAAQRRWLDGMSNRVATWSDVPPGDERPAIPPSVDPDWHRLGRTLNALGSEYDRARMLAAREPADRRRFVLSLAGPALLFSAEGDLVAANDAANDLFQIPVGVGATSVVQTLGSAVLAAAVSDALRGGGSRQVAAEVGDRYVMVSVSRLDEEVLVIAVDRTEERRVEEVRRNFVVNASHELKTPVTAMQTLIEALGVTVERDPAKAAALVERLDGEVERLANLVRDLLDLRRLEETGPIERSRLDLRRIVDRVVTSLADEASAQHVNVEVSGTQLAEVFGKRDDLELAVRNLVSNAIRYNRAGGRVEVEVADDVDEGCLVTVADSGIGIPRSDLGRIFERFYRVEAARSRQTGGTGLGLSIVRHVIERHGGSISVDSLLGQGTTFTVWLPRAPQN